MPAKRVIFDSASPAGSTFSDPAETLTRAQLAARVAAVAAVVLVLWVSGIVWAVKQERLARALSDDEAELVPVTA